jgi:hypothetical protein
LEGCPLEWASWASKDNYVSDSFYDANSSSSLAAFKLWMLTDPLTADGSMLASYKQVEVVLLSIRLALRALWVTQFPDEYCGVPTYVLSSPYPFLEYEKICQQIKDLISGYVEVYVLFVH